MKHTVISSLVAVALCSSLSAYGGGSNAAPLPAPLGGPLLGGIIEERDVNLVFDYMREALQAAMQGREARRPEELTQRAEAIGEELKRRGASAAQAAIDALEQALRDGMRDTERLPPTTSRQSI